MKHVFSRFSAMLIALCLLLSLVPFAAFATEAEKPEDGMAEDISSPSLVTANQTIPDTTYFFDKNLERASVHMDGSWLLLDTEKTIGSLYFIFDVEYPQLTFTDMNRGTEIIYDTENMVHLFVDIEKLFGYAPTSLKVEFSGGGVKINELYVFTPGQPPEWVQTWGSRWVGEADICLFSTHADDEQLFFGGLLPYYAGELGYKVQVVYFTNHRNLNNYRVHELLNGLWAVGVRNYPELGTFPDVFTNTLNNAYGILHNMNITDEQLEAFVVEALRKYKPYVAVGHDFEGEYAHGVHMLYTDLLVKALEDANDPEKFPESAEEYGLWDVPKTYIHMYQEDPIEMDWDQPLSKFDGMTAFEVTRDLGWPAHVSQQKGFLWFYSGATDAKSVSQYGPTHYGLYRSTVGKDVQKNDFFENITRDLHRVAHPEDIEETVPEETEPIEPETTVPETEPETEAAPKVAEPEHVSKEGRWLYFPAFGALVLLAAAVIVTRSKKR